METARVSLLSMALKWMLRYEFSTSRQFHSADSKEHKLETLSVFLLWCEKCIDCLAFFICDQEINFVGSFGSYRWQKLWRCLLDAFSLLSAMPLLHGVYFPYTRFDCPHKKMWSYTFPFTTSVVSCLAGSTGLLVLKVKCGFKKDCSVWKITWWSCWGCSCAGQPWKGRPLAINHLAIEQSHDSFSVCPDISTELVCSRVMTIL